MVSSEKPLTAVSENDPIEIADIIAQAPDERQLFLFKGLSPAFAVQVFEFLPIDVQLLIINGLETPVAVELLGRTSPDDRTAFLAKIPIGLANAFIRQLPIEERAIAKSLLGYPKDSIGRLMTTDYITVKLDWTVKEVLDYIRKYGRDSETVTMIFVVDDNYKLIDDVRIREFLFAPLDKTVRDLSDTRFVALEVTEKIDQAIQAFTRYGRSSLPVIDESGKLLGIVTFDDVLHIINTENTRDVQKIGGTQALEYPYMETDFLSLMRKRANWLVLLFIGEMFTATAMGFFEQEIAQAVVLALFLPLIISSGGNSGSQASTLIIRALAVGEIKLSDWKKIMWREIMSGLFLGALLGTIGFMRISVWSAFSSIYGPSWPYLAATIFFALTGVVLWGSLSGAMLPLLLVRFGVDPATASAPLVATIVDVTGIIIYFATAAVLLNGILL